MFAAAGRKTLRHHSDRRHRLNEALPPDEPDPDPNGGSAADSAEPPADPRADSADPPADSAEPPADLVKVMKKIFR